MSGATFLLFDCKAPEPNERLLGLLKVSIISEKVLKSSVADRRLAVHHAPSFKKRNVLQIVFKAQMKTVLETAVQRSMLHEKIFVALEVNVISDYCRHDDVALRAGSLRVKNFGSLGMHHEAI